VKKRTKTTVRRMLYLLKRGAIFPLGGDGMYINPPKSRIVQIEASD